MSILSQILERYDGNELLKADGFDNAVIGIDSRGMRLIYSRSKCIDILVKQGLSYEEAIEHFDFNVEGAYVGEQTPIWCEDDYEHETTEDETEKGM